VVAIAFKPGDTVKKGALLLQLDPRPYKAALEKAEAEAERAEAGVKRATAHLTRVKRVAETAPGGKEEVEIATVAQADAEAALKAARAGVELARLNLESTKVTSPISGRAGRPAVVPGSLVTAASHLVAVEAMDPVHVAFDIDEATALHLLRGKPGKKAAEVTAQVGLIDEVGLPHRCLPDFTGLRFDPSTGTARARVILPNTDGVFLPGLSATVRLVEGKPYKALMVSTRAILSDTQGLYVLVVNPGGVIERRQVKAGRQSGSLVPVKEGLKEADQVVLDLVSPTARMRGGDPLPVIGMSVDPQKVPMPERATRSASSLDRPGFRPAEGMRKGKAKGNPGP
jgi:multidrug efflux system membrane fusion protein